MPRKSAAEKAAEEEAAAELAAAEEQRRVTQQRLRWAALAIIALALFAGGYAAGQASSDDVGRIDGDFPPYGFLPYAEGFEVGPGEFDPAPLRVGPELWCDVVEQNGPTVVLVCNGPGASEDDGWHEDPWDDDDHAVGGEGFLGIGIADTPTGVVVIDMLPAGPAARAGIELDDVIVAFDGIAIESTEQLADLIAGTGPGVAVSITVERFGSEVTVDVVLGERRD